MGVSISRLLPDLAATLRRFPLPALAVVAYAIYANLNIEQFMEGGRERYLFAAWSAFIAAGAGHLFAEARGWPALQNSALAALAGLLAGAG